MALIYRKFEAGDRLPVYRLFRESVWDYMLSCGIVESSDMQDIESFMSRQYDFYLHLERTAAEDWVAVDDASGIVGWARSIERDGHLQLTHFFVATATQGQGAGRELLQRAFPPGRGRQRSIIATTNPSALSLYLRNGVSSRGMAYCFEGEPKRRVIESELQAVRLEAGDASLRQLADLDASLLGFRRDVDIRYFAEHQPTFLFYRDGKAVAYAFGAGGNSIGPLGALDPADLPALLQHVDNCASEAGLESLSFTIPAAAATAVDWALASGFRIFPFYEVLLSSGPTLRLEHYVMTESSFTW